MSTASDEKIAYMILAHQDPIHLERLIKAIDYKSHVFIHLDKKTNIKDFLHISKINSVEFTSNRHKVYWGGLSMVNAILELIKLALGSGEDYSHLVLLSGADYPIKPVENFYNFLLDNPGKQFIKSTKICSSPGPSERRVTHYWFLDPLQPFFDDRFVTKYIEKIFHHLRIKRQPPEDILLAWGSGNWIITPECASFIIKYLEENPKFYNFYKYAHCVDEQVFHTIVANSPFLESAGGIYTDFSRPFELSNVTLNFIGRVFDENDYPLLEDIYFNRTPTIKRLAKDMIKRNLLSDSLNHGSYFFARKFTTNKSSKLLDLIDKNLLFISL